MKNNSYLNCSLFTKILCNFSLLTNALLVFNLIEISDARRITEYGNLYITENSAIGHLTSPLTHAPNATRNNMSPQLTINGNVYNFIYQLSPPTSQVIRESVANTKTQNAKLGEVSSNSSSCLEFSSEDLNRQLGKTVSDTIVMDIKANQAQKPKKISDDEYMRLMENTICNNEVSYKTHHKHVSPKVETAGLVADVFTKMFKNFPFG